MPFQHFAGIITIVANDNGNDANTWCKAIIQDPGVALVTDRMCVICSPFHCVLLFIWLCSGSFISCVLSFHWVSPCFFVSSLCFLGCNGVGWGCLEWGCWVPPAAQEAVNYISFPSLFLHFFLVLSLPCISLTKMLFLQVSLISL